MSLDINQSPAERKTSLVDITELSANPHELAINLYVLGAPRPWENEDLTCGKKEKRELIFDRRSLIDRIPIMESCFQCWNFG
ncbi:hypothetical protein AVEN_131347-1 [Araneus ventricosus]|uniref:Uncharacterized protein n=1 Tax=Araneus ventricosus TaxID=182803 RepID=A0A4Y2QTF9_ARAVE|nr:hypothetical protein AVEN_131347-1 [Araneus ventricosus]